MMDKGKNQFNRRQFLKTLAIGGAALAGCTKESKYVYEPPAGRDLPKTQVALFRTTDRREGVRQVMSMLDFPSPQDQHVILKPNFNTADPPPASTHNDTLSQLVTEIQNLGASAITLAERSFQPFHEVIQNKNIEALANDLGFTILNLETASRTHFTHDELHWNDGFHVPDIIRDAEYLVSTCCLKTHQFGGGFTMSLKSSVGILPAMHMGELHGSPNMRKMIAEINLAYQPDLIVMDGVKAFISGGPSSGIERDGNVMVAGMDRVAVDVVGLAILKELGSTVIADRLFEEEQIERAAELELGIVSPEQIEFVTVDTESEEFAERLTRHY